MVHTCAKNKYVHERLANVKHKRMRHTTAVSSTSRHQLKEDFFQGDTYYMVLFSAKFV